VLLSKREYCSVHECARSREGLLDLKTALISILVFRSIRLNCVEIPYCNLSKWGWREYSNIILDSRTYSSDLLLLLENYRCHCAIKQKWFRCQAVSEMYVWVAFCFLFSGIWCEQRRRDITEGVQASYGEPKDLFRVSIESTQRTAYQWQP